MNQKTVSIFVLLLLFFVAGISTVGASTCVKCNNTTITDFHISYLNGTTPLQEGFTGHVKNAIKVTYQVINSNGTVAYATSSTCGKCLAGTCSCSCIITKAGNYSVKMIAYGPGGCCINLTTRSNVIYVKAPAKCVMCYSDVVSGKNVTFKDCSTGVTEWYWSFGDGKASSLENPIHTYANFGTYHVCLQAYCPSCHCWKAICKTVKV